MENLIEYIRINKLGVVYTNKKFKDLTTLRIGGDIKLLFYPSTIENFIIFYKYYLNNKEYPLLVIGNGSNILASSLEYNGIVISFKKIKFKYFLINNILTINSGVMIMDVINYCKKNNLSGLEKLSYIPGTIGGMVKMNAGAYNCNISDCLLTIKTINDKGEINYYNKKDIDFNYRKSSIKNNEIILECSFKFKRMDKKFIQDIINNIRKNRNNKQPLDSYNAGSTFKNTGKIKVWKLINDLGLRGYSINDAQVSSKHCNFLINKNNCSSDDMVRLINHIIYEVYNKYNIKLECEWDLINFKKSIYFL